MAPDDPDDDFQEDKAKGAGKKNQHSKPRKKKTVVPNIEAGVGSSTGQTGQGGPGREEDIEAGATPYRARDPAWDNATQEAREDYQAGAL